MHIFQKEAKAIADAKRQEAAAKRKAQAEEAKAIAAAKREGKLYLRWIFWLFTLMTAFIFN